MSRVLELVMEKKTKLLNKAEAVKFLAEGLGISKEKAEEILVTASNLGVVTPKKADGTPYDKRFTRH
jgi:hypothetical protein